MTDFQERLEAWFIKMGYPVDDAEKTDWKKVCCGRLPEYWTQTMSRYKPKSEVKAIREKELLQETEKYKQYENSSASKIGIITPPAHIFYPAEMARLRKKLDSLNVEIASETLSVRNKLEEKKRQCIDVQKTREDIISIYKQIFVMEEALKKVNEDIENCRKMNEFPIRLHKIADDLSKHEFGDDEGFLADLSHNIDDKLFQSILRTSKLRTSELLHLIIEYIDRISQATKDDYLSSNEMIYNGSKDCLPLERGLTNLKLFHSYLVIETLQQIRQNEHAGRTCNMAKENVLKTLSNDSEIFLDRCSKIYSKSYNDSLQAELNRLDNNETLNELISNSGLKKLDKSFNVYAEINKVKGNYMKVFDEINKKVDKTHNTLKKISEVDAKIQSRLMEIKNSKTDKILWRSDFKLLQDQYLKLLLKKPALLNAESGNPFGCLHYLLTIISEYNLEERLRSTGFCIQTEIKWLRLTADVDYFNEKSIEKHEEFVSSLRTKYLMKLQPLSYNINFYVRQMKYKHALESIRKLEKTKTKPSSVDDVLSIYIGVDLRDLERKSLADAAKHMRKNPNSSRMDAIVDDFNETLDFFSKINK